MGNDFMMTLLLVSGPGKGLLIDLEPLLLNGQGFPFLPVKIGIPQNAGGEDGAEDNPAKGHLLLIFPEKADDFAGRGDEFIRLFQQLLARNLFSRHRLILLR